MGKKTGQRIHLLRELVNDGHRIFTMSQVRGKAKQLNINEKYIAEALYHLKRDNWIRTLKRGVYALTAESGFGSPPHNFEIAMALVSPSAISHWTALYHHHLTQQIPQTIFALTTTGTTISRSTSKSDFRFIQIKPEYYFGISQIWVENAKINITDPERTLLDGLLKPQYCGDFQEVLFAFKMRGNELDIKKIIHYALKLPSAVAQRLGWVLDFLEFHEYQIDPLEQKAFTVKKLDASGPIKGSINHRWKIQENIGIE